MSKFYVTVKLGEKRSLTPEGFLVCEDVPIARTGEMVYLPEEITFSDGSHPEPAEDGKIHLWRADKDLFRPETIASAEGKPVVTCDGHHVDLDVDPDNWQYLAVGSMQHVRRGEGGQSGLMLADFLINSQRGIDDVNSGKDEVSIKYDYRLDMTGAGVGNQTDIIINHVAIVETARGGPVLRIGDESPNRGASPMAKLPFWARAMGHALKAGDEETAAEIAKEREEDKVESDDEGEDGIETRFKALEEGIKALGEGHAKILERLDSLGKIDPPAAAAADEGEVDDEKDEDIDKMKAGDSGRALLKQEWQETASKAEILAPGCQTRLPAFESVKTTQKAADSMDRVRRAALDHALGTDAGRAAVSPFLRGRSLDALDPGGRAVVFAGAAELRRAANNRQSAGDGVSVETIPPNTQMIYNRLYGR